MSKKMKKDENGNYQFKVTFNYREEDNGYVLGTPRNYSTSKVKSLVNSKETKKWIDNGNAVIMYGHGARDIAKNRFAPSEHNPHNGKTQLPIGKITKLSINQKNHNLIDFEGFFIPTNENSVESIVKLIENDLGGFSFVWNVPKGIFYGADYVLVQNFSSNKPTLDALNEYCDSGECPLSTTFDNMVEDMRIPYILYDEARELFENQEEVIGIKDVLLNMKALKATLDGKNEFIEKLERLIIEKDRELATIKKANAEVTKKLTANISSLKAKIKIDAKKKITLRAANKVLLDAIEEVGELEGDENKKTIKTKGLDKLFIRKTQKTFEDFDPSKIINVKKKEDIAGSSEWNPSFMR